MAITPAQLVTLCFMLAFRPTGLDDLPPMKPRLSTRPTQDITVTCQLAAFVDTHRSFHPDLLQVVQNSTGKQDWAALATLNLADGTVSASDHLRQSAHNLYVVHGTKDGKVIRNSWLSLSVASIHDTSFWCEVEYSDSGTSKTWRSKVFPFPTNNKTYPGITVTVTEGLSVECFYKPQGGTATGTFSEIVRTDTNRDLCQQQEKWDEQQLCSFRNAFVGGAATKEAHIFNTSQDEGMCHYQCRFSGVTPKEMDETEICCQGSSAMCIQWWVALLALVFGVLLPILIYQLQRWMHRSGRLLEC